MNKLIFAIYFFSICLVLGSCRNSTAETSQDVEVIKSDALENAAPDQEGSISIFIAQSVNDELAIQIKDYIADEFLSPGELDLIPEFQRKFQLYEIDLNADGKNEVFVNFITSYFCGTGGCTILLLNEHLKPITKFRVTRTPLFAETTKENGWRILLTRSQGELKELVYKNGSYPSNPSIIDKALYDAPSGHAEILFDETFSKAKTYEF